MAKLLEILLIMGCLLIVGNVCGPVLLEAEVDSSEEADTKELFELHDKNGDGKITLDELESFIKPGDGMTFEKLKAFFEILDIDGNGSLSFEEFKAMAG